LTNDLEGDDREAGRGEGVETPGREPRLHRSRPRPGPRAEPPRLDALWRYDQYIANAEGHAFLQEFWRELKFQDQEAVKRLKELIAEEIKKDCF
jgi:hypothetical protein